MFWADPAGPWFGEKPGPRVSADDRHEVHILWELYDHLVALVRIQRTNRHVSIDLVGWVFDRSTYRVNGVEAFNFRLFVKEEANPCAEAVELGLVTVLPRQAAGPRVLDDDVLAARVVIVRRGLLESGGHINAEAVEGRQRQPVKDTR